MPSRERTTRVVRGIAPSTGDTRLCAGLAQHLLVTGGADAVENHPGDPDCRIERRKPVQQRGDALALAARVDDQDHRRAEESGDVSGRAACVFVDAPVEQAHHALHHGDVGAGAPVPVQRADQVLADQDGVEVAAGPAGGQRVVAGVDVVGTDLERRDGVAGAPQRTDQTRCDGGLSAARCGRGDHDGWDAHLLTCSPAHPSPASVRRMPTRTARHRHDTHARGKGGHHSMPF